MDDRNCAYCDSHPAAALRLEIETRIFDGITQNSPKIAKSLLDRIEIIEMRNFKPRGHGGRLERFINPMKITVILDGVLAGRLQEAAHRSGRSLDDELNEAVRVGLRSTEPIESRRPFVVEARNLGLRPGIDPDRLKEFAAELEIEAYIEKRDRHLRENA